jgi:nicotinamidase-related amidase
MNPSRWLALVLPALALWPACAAEMTVDLRSRVEAFKGSGEWREVSLQQSLPAEKTAVLICDMWDKHWCGGATGRVNALAAKMAPFLESARKQGIQIIHAPSETMPFYQDTPQRKRILAVGKIDPPAPLNLPDPPLPIDDTRGGCDTPDQFYKAWTREHPGLRIDPSDVISDNGAEIYSFLRERDIRTLLVMGVHTNMCVLNRTFAIKRMTALGIHCILVRDLTDAMYNPEDPPHVSHDAGTQLVIEYIEKFWCPSTTSAALLRAFVHSPKPVAKPVR